MFLPNPNGAACSPFPWAKQGNILIKNLNPRSLPSHRLREPVTSWQPDSDNRSSNSNRRSIWHRNWHTWLWPGE